MDAMWQDLRFAARNLLRSRLFTAGVIALLAFGIAANTIIFSLVDALLLRPLPVRDPERLERLVTIRPALGARSNFRLEEYRNWKQGVSGFEDMLAWSEFDLFVASGENTERARIHFVTGNFFTSLGASAAVGRVLTADDERLAEGAAPVVLSYPYWKRRFNGDSGMVGRTIDVNGRKALVVGVTARGFNGLSVETGPDLRAPIGWLHTMVPSIPENEIYCEVVARLRPGVSRETVRQEAEAVWRNNWERLNGAEEGVPGQFALEPAARGISRLRNQFSGVIWLLMGGVALLMLMVCANVAGLLMARTASRQGELAIRAAMGAGRLRLVLHLFSEALLLMAGGVAGAITLSYGLIPHVVDALPPVRDFGATRLALTLDIAPDWRVLGFTLFASAVTVLLFGLLPALVVTNRDLHPLLKQIRAGGHFRGRQLLVTVQIALCTMLLVGAGLMILTLNRLERIDAGFERDRIVTFTVETDLPDYKPEQAASLQRRLLQGAKELPGVESAAVSARALMRGTGMKSSVVRAGEPVSAQDFMNVSLHSVSPEYFATMHIKWLAGRNFTGQEDLKHLPRPAVVNEAFVRRFGNGRSVIGEKFGSAAVGHTPAKATFEVIGVVGDTKYRSLREPFQPIVYGLVEPDQGFILHIRSRSVPEAMIAPMRQLLSRIDPRVSFVEITTLASEVETSLWAERVAALLATIFSAAAVLIAAAGLYALVTFAALQRRREIGIRVALGALPGDIVRLISSAAVWLAGMGILLGLGIAAALAPMVAPLLYGVPPRDGAVLLVAAGIAFAITSAAMLIPSLRASRLRPSSVLREE